MGMCLSSCVCVSLCLCLCSVCHLCEYVWVFTCVPGPFFPVCVCECMYTCFALIMYMGDGGMCVCVCVCTHPFKRVCPFHYGREGKNDEEVETNEQRIRAAAL